MKKSFLIILISAFLFSVSITGCSSSGDDNGTPPPAGQVTVDKSKQEEQKKEDEQKKQEEQEPQQGKGLCATKYPIVMVHGLGWKDVDGTVVEYFYKIPETLRQNGAIVYPPRQISFGGQKTSAESLIPIVSEVLSATKSKKVNLIGQSQGGPIMRYFLANCEVPVWWDSKPKKASEVVASCTAIGSPNKGSYICDALAGIITCDPTVESIVTKALEAAAKYLWNEDVNSKEAFIETSDVYMETVFNKEIPIVGPENGGINDGVYYQSYAGKISGLLPTANAALFVPTGFLLDMMEGNSLDYDGNDGFVSVHSTKIGDFRGIIPTANWMLGGGADHAYQLNHFFGLTPGFDAKKFYIDLVAELKVKGY